MQLRRAALVVTALMHFAVPAVADDCADAIRDNVAKPRDLVAAAKIGIAGEHEEAQQAQDEDETQTQDEHGAALIALLLLVLTGRL